MKRIWPLTLAAALAVAFAPPAGMAQVTFVSGPGMVLNAPAQPDLQKLSGTVTDPSGAPAANLEVSMQPQFVSPVQTDAGGKFEFNWRQPGGRLDRQFSLMARDTAHNLAVIQRFDQTATNVDLRLKDAVTLGVKVRDSAGNPLTIATARVTMFSENNNSTGLNTEALADANGQIEVAALPAGLHYQLNVMAPGYGSASLNAETDQTTGKRFDFPTVTLPKADRQLAGQVLGADGKPVGGANVSLSGNNQPGASTRADDLGHFRFNQVVPGPPGAVTLYVSAQNSSANNILVTAGDLNVTVRLTPAPVRNPTTFTQPNSSIITGVVTDPSGAPVARARISLVPRRGGEAQTDDSGHYSLTWNPPQGNSRIPVSILAREMTRNLAALEAIENTTTNHDLKLDRGVTLAVKAVDAHGKPISGATARVQLYQANPTGGTYTSQFDSGISSDADGQIEAKGLPAGLRYSLNVQAVGYGTASVSAEAGETTAGKRIDFPTVTLKTADKQLAGQVLDTGGKPVSGVSVNLSGNGQPAANTRADSQGRFKFDRVLDGQVNVSANYNPDNGGNTQFGSVSATAGDTNVVVRLGVNQRANIVTGVPVNRPGVPVVTTTGRVLDTNEAPVAGIQVRMWPPYSSGPGGIVTDSQGRFSLTWQPRPGNSVPGIMAFDEAHNLAVGESIDSTTTNKNLRLKPALTISGVVQDDKGNPAAAATVQLQFYSGTLSPLNPQPTRVDANGAFEFHTLPRGGQYGLVVSADGYTRKNVTIESTATETATLKLDPIVITSGNLVFAGLVQELDFSPLVGATVTVGGGNQPASTVRTDATGHFKTKSAEGNFRVQILHPNGTVVSLPAEGGDTNFLYRFGGDNPAFNPPTTLTISGIITDPTGTPATNVLIVSPAPAAVRTLTRNPLGGFNSVVTAPPNGGQVRTDENGHYTLTYQPAGANPFPRAGGRANAAPRHAYLIARDTANNFAGMVEMDGKATNVNLRLSPGLTITGSVVDSETSKPMPTATLQTTYEYPLEPPLRYQTETVTVDADGAFVMAGLLKGITVSMRVAGGGDNHGAVNRSVGPPDTAGSEVKIPPIAVKSFNLRLAGKVVTEDGAPVPNASFVVMGPGFPNNGFRTDGTGHFDIKTSDGPNYVTITTPRSPTFTFQGGDTNIVITVPAGVPAAGATLTARAGGRMPGTMPAATGTTPNQILRGGFGGFGGGAAPTIVVTGSSPSGEAITASTVARPPATIRVAARNTVPGTAFVKVLIGLATAQFLLLALVAGGVLWFTRRGGP